MDTVLGLAITPSIIGWVMADGGSDGFPTVTGDEVSVAADDDGPDAVDTAASAVAVAIRIRAMVIARGERLRGVSVTWSDEAAVGAALLLEALSDAGFDHVVPVRYARAAAALANAVGTRHERAAVCVIEPGLACLVVHDAAGERAPSVTVRAITDLDEVTGWLSDTVGAGDRRPDLLVVAGSMRGMDRLGRRLESTLSMPVVVRSGAQLALARGAASALAPDIELAEPARAATGMQIGRSGGRRAHSWSHAGALLMLVLGLVTFVGSVAAALSLQVGSGREVPIQPPGQHATVARVAIPAASPPAVAPPAAPAQPPVPVETAPSEESAAQDPSAEFGSLWDAHEVESGAVAAEQGDLPSRVDRVREHIFGRAGS